MGDVVLSAFLQVIFQSISDFVKKELWLKDHIEKERERLISNMDMIQAILMEAEKKTQLSELQKRLVGNLKDASNGGIEALDDHLYEVQRRQVIHFADIRNSTICSSMNLLRAKFNHEMETKIVDFKKRIEVIKSMQEISRPFQVDVQGHRGQNNEGSGLGPSTLLPPTVVRGRDDDCKSIVEKLLQTHLGSNVGVLPILGEPYIGKTTVAQLVLNNESVSMHFELMLWVHVSPEFNIEWITSSIIESVEGYPFHSDNLNTLQTRLEKLLRGRRYLLVLDDCWNDNWQDWDKLKRPFVSGARGSKIIVTTRIGTVAQVLGTLAPYKLNRLKDEDCWLLFSQRAQGIESYARSYEDIQDNRLKEEVLRICKGVPFIAASIGYSINRHRENDISKWADILREEWDSSDHFHKALRLSYAHLDYHLKPCFAYSSIIPPKFLFEEEWLIQHWMAQGFIGPNPNTGQTMEDTGRSYFSSLVNQSFFQTAHVDRTGQHSYRLSEIMLKLALLASDEACKCHVVEGPCSLPEKVRYLTVIFNKPGRQDLFKEISGGERLHTLIVVGGSEDYVLKIPDDIGQRFIRLRTLDLSNFCVSELPESIGKMKYLRCLQLRSTKIRRLPESICRLYLLQTLGLRNCYDLEELPSKLKDLRKLRHIDLVMTRKSCHSICRLKCMPKHIGLLTDLQTLSRFVISKDGGGIAELAKLNNLRGELLISNLHLVEDVEKVARANLASKQFLQKLELSWSNNNNNNKQAEQVLQHLKPPINIKELRF